MKVNLLKAISQKTYKNSKGQDVPYVNFYIQAENGTRIQIKAAFDRDYPALKALADAVVPGI